KLLVTMTLSSSGRSEKVEASTSCRPPLCIRLRVPHWTLKALPTKKRQAPLGSSRRHSPRLVDYRISCCDLVVNIQRIGLNLFQGSQLHIPYLEGFLGLKLALDI
ncbi:hypothetical protein HAX54_032374, partial [Datura stramonium]|nr:hypothetical protein [Datura stramonium]